MNDRELPPLPPYMYGREVGRDERVWSERCMRDYAKEAVRIERERWEAAMGVRLEPLLLQDENSGRDGRRYNEWHASRPDARLNAREAAASLSPKDQT